MTRGELQAWIDLICYGIAYGGLLIYCIYEALADCEDDSEIEDP